ncbi:MAG: cyclic nucleotide-binding domain-containing protein [Spirochaetaceae bacterium]|nr:cyclic nucleotide-binding domain-containing protein [Spirochaetaceae bacterium]
MRKYQITDGVYYLDISEANLRVLCGSPMDIVKNLMRSGFIQKLDDEGFFESGPNAILLSDVSVQNGGLCNLTEFPIMHMFYQQGMRIEGHDNFGQKPLVIGIPEQIEAQISYLERGANGLSDNELANEANLPPHNKQELLALKKSFKGGNLKSASDLIDFKAIEFNETPIAIADGIDIVRMGINVYLFIAGSDEEIIDLTLTADQHYAVPYNLGFYPSTRRDFSIIHSGEGNGWNRNHASMASIVCAKGKYYIIDAGPNVLESLNKLGIAISEVEGIFMTHAHDDHFSGLTSIIRSQKRIKFFAIQAVRLSIMKKLASLINFNANLFKNFFEICDLTLDSWNQLDGFEVLPILSPHPIETNAFFFRMAEGDGYRSYGHLADIISKRVFNNYINADTADKAILQKCYDYTWSNYLRSVNVKKIDANGGLIHGEIEDFEGDSSGKLVASHTTGELSDNQRFLACNGVFGSEELLIAASQDYLQINALTYLDQHFPFAGKEEVLKLTGFKRILINAGNIIITNNVIPDCVYLILSGTVEYLSLQNSVQRFLEAGAIIGDASVINNKATQGCYRAESYIKALQIPSSVFREFINTNVNFDKFSETLHLYHLLQKSPLFKPVTDRSLVQNLIKSTDLYYYDYNENDTLLEGNNNYIGIILEGMAGLFYEDTLVETLNVGDYYGQEGFLNSGDLIPSVVALSPISVLCLPFEIFLKIPVLLWSLVESADKTAKLIAQTARLSKLTDNDNLVL